MNWYEKSLRYLLKVFGLTRDVAKYMTARGVTTFVLKYRLAHTGDDATEEFTALYADQIVRDRDQQREVLNARRHRTGDHRR